MPLPIEDYALIGDTHAAALVGMDGSIDWRCLPRFDSAACFAALLGDADNGRWRIAPSGATRAARRAYADQALVLRTEWEVAGGRVEVVDFMPPRSELPDVVRLVKCIEGQVEMEMELVLRFDYGRLVPWVRQVAGDVWAVAGPEAVCLRASVPAHGEDMRTIARFTLRAGETASFVLSWHPSHEP